MAGAAPSTDGSVRTEWQLSHVLGQPAHATSYFNRGDVSASDVIKVAMNACAITGS